MDVAAAEHGEVSVDLVDNVNRSVYHETNDGFFHGNGRFICALSQCVMLLFVSFLFFFVVSWLVVPGCDADDVDDGSSNEDSTFILNDGRKLTYATTFARQVAILLRRTFISICREKVTLLSNFHPLPSLVNLEVLSLQVGAGIAALSLFFFNDFSIATKSGCFLVHLSVSCRWKFIRLMKKNEIKNFFAATLFLLDKTV